jgi:hypothetical protein
MMRMRVHVVTLVLGLVALAPRLEAQTASLHSPNSERAATREIFPAPLASPTEPANMLRFAGDGQFDFGLTQPLGLFKSEGARSTWEIGLLPGIVARFKVRDTQLLLKAADFHIGIPLSYRRGNWSTRVEFFHASSHRGADFASAYPEPSFNYSREVLQALVAYGRAGHWRVYAGPSVLLHTIPALGRMSFEAGSEWFPKSLRRTHARFYLAEDFETRQEVGWNLNTSIQPGILFTNRHAEPVARLAGWFYRGQSPFGQFFRQRETSGGVQLILELRPAIRSLVTRRR